MSAHNSSHTLLSPEQFRENFDVWTRLWPENVKAVANLWPEELIRATEQNMIDGYYRMGLNLTNSKNSSLPPSKDNLGQADLTKTHNKDSKDSKDSEPKRKPGGQPNHPGSFLRQVDNPDKVVILKPNLPEGIKCFPTGKIVKRQVFDVYMTRFVVEYQAEIYEDEFGHKYIANFPSEAGAYCEYGSGVKSLVLLLSVYEMMPYERTALMFKGYLGKPMSEGTIANFIEEAYDFLAADYVPWAKCRIIGSDVAFFDETPINIAGNYASAIVACTSMVKVLEAHSGRSIDALESM